MAEKRCIDAYELAEVIESMDIRVAGKSARWYDAKHSVLREIGEAPTVDVKETIYGSWEMVLDDFDDGAGIRELPHCSNCHRGVYKHDAGSWCPFCGAAMKNPMR